MPQANSLPTDHTFVVCAFGESPYLEECVRSVTEQSVKTNVIMSTSTMNGHIRAISAKYGVPLYHNTGSGDMQGNWNFGVSCVKTRFVTVCHQDDYYSPDYFKRAREAFSDDMLMLHTGYYDVLDGVTFKNFNNKMRSFLNFPLRLKPLQRMRFAKKNALRFGNTICCPSCTYNAEKLGKPIFVSKLKHGCDWDIYIDMACREGAMAYIPEELCMKRTHKNSATAGDIKSGLRAREDLYLFRRLWPAPLARLMLSVYKRIYKYSV